jgi:V8-like Glu-specific endopeptidase
MPEWPGLRIADHGPHEGELIHATGYGNISHPFLSMASGQVDGTLSASDGTPLFGISFMNPSGPGSSGSPVLNTAGEVVGLLAWGDATNRYWGVAQDVSVVRHPCS